MGGRVIDVYASATHYAEHLAPVWAALSPAMRGLWLAPADVSAHARSLGIGPVVPLPTTVRGYSGGMSGYRAEVVESVVGERDVPTVVSSYGDLRDIRAWRTRIALMEHGAGLSYMGDRRSRNHPSYAGGKDRRGVELFLVPGRYPAERNRAAYPNVPVVEIGCPKLDRWHGIPAPRNPKPVVAFAWHWDCRVVPETRSAFDHFGPALGKLADDGRWTVIGGAHHRASNVRRAYGRHGIEQVTLADAMERADVLVADNTSAVYEFAAATDRPVVVLNAPWYRRDVHHGLRFWEAVPGLECDDPRDLPDAIATALRDRASMRRQRAKAVEAAYTYRGDASKRAASALEGWVA